MENSTQGRVWAPVRSWHPPEIPGEECRRQPAVDGQATLEQVSCTATETAVSSFTEYKEETPGLGGRG